MDERFLNTGFKEKIDHVAEECGEVVAAYGKMNRFGMQSVNPLLPLDQQETNLDWILREIEDLYKAINRLKLHMNQDITFTKKDESKKIYVHQKTGGIYQKVARVAKVQTNIPLQDYDRVVVYEGEDGETWIRPESEFKEKFKEYE